MGNADTARLEFYRVFEFFHCLILSPKTHDTLGKKGYQHSQIRG